MQEDSVSGLISLRESILSDIGPLVAESDMSVSERLGIYMRLAHEHSGVEYYEKAYRLLKESDDVEDKLSFYLNLLGDIDFEINAAAKTSDDAEDESQPETTQ